MLHNDSDEGSTTIANERNDILNNNSDEGVTSIMRDLEAEEIEMSDNSATHGSNSDDLYKNNSSQVSQNGNHQYFLHLEIKVEGRRKQRSLIAKKKQG